MENGSIKVGFGVAIFKEGKLLLGKRKGSHGASEYAGPGGHLEYMESFEEGVLREIAEEVGVQVKNIRFLCLNGIKNYPPVHYVDIGFVADWESGEPKVLEPDKVESWDWYDLEALPELLFGGVGRYIEAYKTGKNFFDT